MLLSLVALALVATGCAKDTQQVTRDADGYEPQIALALATTPPAVLDYVDVDALDDALARDGRDTTAFVGFDSETFITYDLVVRDYQNYGTGGYGFGFGSYGGFGSFGSYGYGYVPFQGYSRRATSTKTFTRVR